MIIIFIYGGSGTFLGKTVYEWDHPKEGNVHKFILFLAQSDHTSRQDIAAKELHNFGFVNCKVNEGLPISVDALNTPHMHIFHKHYEGAFSEGVSIVWYPQ
jgi:hypothetical protein